MKTNASSKLEAKTKAELIKEIERLRTELGDGNGSNGVSAGKNGKFDEEDLIAMGSPHAGEEMYVATDTGKIVYANERFADELGYTPQELATKKVPDIEIYSNGG